MQHARHLLLVFLVVAFPTSPSFSQDLDNRERSAAWDKKLSDQFDGGRRFGVFIAIDKYQPPLNPVPSVPGVKLVADTLAQCGGYDPEHLTLVLDEEATKSNAMKVLTDVLKEAGPRDTVVVMFVGHGFVEDGQSILCPYDFDQKNGKLTGLRTDDIRTMLNDCKAAQKIFILESCHSGGAKGVNTADHSSQELAGAFSEASGLITFASSRRSQTSLVAKGGKIGLYSTVFAKGLSGEADFDRNGIVDSDEQYRYLMLEVPSGAELIHPGHKQYPVRIIGEDVVGVFALSRPNGNAPPDDLVRQPPRPKAGDEIVNAIGMKFIFLATGAAKFGSPRTEYLRNDDEAQQAILITRPTYMGVHEVTQSQFAKVTGRNPSYYSKGGDGAGEVEGIAAENLPVEQVSWEEAATFCEKLSALPEEVAAGRGYRLPSECEWEYACRAGTSTVFHTGDRLSPKEANIRGDRPYLDSEEGTNLGRTAPVGSYAPNAFGLHDMHGNVAEWCQDFYIDKRFLSFTALGLGEGGSSDVFFMMLQTLADADENSKKAMAFPADPTGPLAGETRVYRGGAFTGDVAFCRSACRRSGDPAYAYRGIGFRVVCYPLPSGEGEE